MAVIAVDFDGCVVSHEFPNVGKDIGSVPVLKELIENGHQLILYTMRSDVENPTSENKNIILKSGKFLTDAINWYKDNGIPLYSVYVNPTQYTWTTSPKCYCDLLIDDCALGVPLKFDNNISERFFVDWIKVRKMLVINGYIKIK